jgi:hypothetical protein
MAAINRSGIIARHKSYVFKDILMGVAVRILQEQTLSFFPPKLSFRREGYIAEAEYFANNQRCVLCKILRFSRRWLWRMPSFGMWRRVDLAWTLKMESIRSYETSVHIRSIWRHIQEDGILQRCFLIHRIQIFLNSGSQPMLNIFSTQRVRLEGQFFANLHWNILQIPHSKRTPQALYRPIHPVDQSKSACMETNEIYRGHRLVFVTTF